MKRPHLTTNQGQALVELLLSFPLLITIVAGAALLFRTEWDRTRCAYQVFLAAHRALRSDQQMEALQSLSSLSQGIRVQETDYGVQAQAKCGKRVETVELPALEEARW